MSKFSVGDKVISKNNMCYQGMEMALRGKRGHIVLVDAVEDQLPYLVRLDEEEYQGFSFWASEESLDLVQGFHDTEERAVYFGKKLN